ncbi:DUF3305 domain-containing protein [Neptuniibacter sp.]|uniref:DUF3305 domain-containing protein n=1 Tax=Neptuniibacter sp. TaxID=1962643 RepID=UPI002605D58A|nr:DUF3305 domain-containing protein [Neptuniibacter sp.]MCP4595548.1 DUF3305 domain-containing protein [Neptuniibacter sp.]
MTDVRSSDRWPLQIELNSETIEVGGWDSERWSISSLHPDQKADKGYNLTLELHKDERTDYRFNLNSVTPHLFVLCCEDEASGEFTPMHITASQDDAASFMDGEHQILETPMPPAIQCWVDTYLGIHGELIDAGKKKKKRGKGRSSGR